MAGRIESSAERATVLQTITRYIAVFSVWSVSNNEVQEEGD